MAIVEQEVPTSQLTRLFALAVLVTIINDFVYLGVTLMEWPTGYLFNTFGSAAILLFIIFRTPLKVWAAGDPAAVARKDEGALSIVLFILALLFSGLVFEPLSQIFPNMQWMDLLAYEHTWMGWMDITIGLLLAAVIEELLFRRIAFRVLTNMGMDIVTMLAVSGLLVAMSHWFSGPAKMADLLILHVVFMLFYIRTRKIAPLVVANFLFNFFAYT